MFSKNSKKGNKNMDKFQEIKKIAQKCLKCNNPLCVKGCPLNNPIPEILSLIEKENIIEACNLLFSNTNVAYICSNLCDKEKSCYGSCVLNKKGDPVPFYKVEEYLSSFYNEDKFKEHKNTNKNAIVVGSGVAGINSAIKLSEEGFNVTIVEKENKIGGVVNNSLPSFRFDDSVLNVYQNILNDLGVKVLLNKEFGKDILFEDLLKYDVCVFAMGTMISKKNFEDSEFVIDAIEVLSDYKKGLNKINDKKVIVTGGGNVAMDVARTLIRCNNDVTIVYRRDLENAPSSKLEINLAKDEGVKFLECFSPVSLDFEENILKSATFEKTILVNDPTSSRKKFEKTGIFENIQCDYIVEAIGQNADYKYLKEKLPTIFKEDGWPIDGCIKYENTLFICVGDYNLGASSFAKATQHSKTSIRKVLEKI